MSRKILIPLIIIVAILGFFAVAITSEPVQAFIFDQIPYNHTSYVMLPNSTPTSGSLAGFESINGKGRDFNFNIILPGAEDYEDPLCYTQGGLNGTGKIDHMQITFDTLKSLISGNMIGAMLNTKFNGTFNMKCAAWTGTGTFNNLNTSNSKGLPGTFIIIGPATDWEGNFTLVPQDGRIAIVSDYIYYPHGNKTPGKIHVVHKVDYM